MLQTTVKVDPAILDRYRTAMDPEERAGLFLRRLDLEVPVEDVPLGEEPGRVYIGVLPILQPDGRYELYGARSLVREMAVAYALNDQNGGAFVGHPPLNLATPYIELAPTHDDYLATIRAMTGHIVDAMLDIVPQVTGYGVTVGGERFTAQYPDPENLYRLEEIARGGITPTRYARPHIKRFAPRHAKHGVPVLHSSSQRKGATKEELVADFTNKSWSELDGSLFVCIDPAHATAETSIKVTQAYIETCGTPKRLVLGFFHSCPDALAKTQMAFPGADCVIGQFNEGTDEKGYLRCLTIGDVSAKEYGAPDKKPVG